MALDLAGQRRPTRAVPLGETVGRILGVPSHVEGRTVAIVEDRHGMYATVDSRADSRPPLTVPFGDTIGRRTIHAREFSSDVEGRTASIVEDHRSGHSAVRTDFGSHERGVPDLG